jgi:NTE family protein
MNAGDSRIESGICLALGGGGVRGFSHLGVLEVLERNEIPIRHVVGTSIGAICGALYALEPRSVTLRERALAYLEADEFKNSSISVSMSVPPDESASFLRNLAHRLKKHLAYQLLLTRPSLFPLEWLSARLEPLVGSARFEDTRIPLTITALDTESGEEVLLRSGRLLPALVASCAIPGFFPPVEYDGRQLFDIGLIYPVPVRASRRVQGGPVVAVDVRARTAYREIFNVNSAMAQILRVTSLGLKLLDDTVPDAADVSISPDVNDTGWAEFSEARRMYEAGRDEAIRMLPSIRGLVPQLR